MKKIIILTIGVSLAILAACAAPLPPIRGTTITLLVNPTTQPEIVTHLRFYRALPTELEFRLAGEVPATGTMLTITNAQYGEVYYATFADADGNESDRSNAATNYITFGAPQVLRLSR